MYCVDQEKGSMLGNREPRTFAIIGADEYAMYEIYLPLVARNGHP